MTYIYIYILCDRSLCGGRCHCHCHIYINRIAVTAAVGLRIYIYIVFHSRRHKQYHACTHLRSSATTKARQQRRPNPRQPPTRVPATYSRGICLRLGHPPKTSHRDGLVCATSNKDWGRGGLDKRGSKSGLFLSTPAS